MLLSNVALIMSSCETNGTSNAREVQERTSASEQSNGDFMKAHQHRTNPCLLLIITLEGAVLLMVLDPFIKRALAPDTRYRCRVHVCQDLPIVCSTLDGLDFDLCVLLRESTTADAW